MARSIEEISAEIVAHRNEDCAYEPCATCTQMVPGNGDLDDAGEGVGAGKTGKIPGLRGKTQETDLFLHIEEGFLFRCLQKGGPELRQTGAEIISPGGDREEKTHQDQERDHSFRRISKIAALSRFRGSSLCPGRDLVYHGIMEILPEIAKRVSVRDFQDREVPGDVLERILEAGRLAPSAKNRQPWRFVAVTDPEKRKLLEKASFGQEHVGSAPVVVACCTTNIEYRMPNGQLSYPIDISLAASFMMLQAVREGLGTCIVTTYDETQAREIITVPFSMRVVLLLALGYGKEKEAGLRERLPLSRVSSIDHW